MSIQFEIGKTYLTRDRTIVRVVDRLENGIVYQEPNGKKHHVYRNGHYSNRHPMEECNGDLMHGEVTQGSDR